MNTLLYLLVLILLVIFYKDILRYFLTVRYYIEESSIDPNFKNIASNILRKSRWNDYYNLREVDNVSNADITILLKTDEEMNDFHTNQEYYDNGKPIRFSVTYQGKKKKPIISINAKNWAGVPESGLSVDDYCTYVINHEFGHGLGFDHQKCGAQYLDNGRCPVMYQSTRGCKNNLCGFQPGRFDRSNKIDVAYLWWT